jgi:predicted metal-dependent peptidase
MAKKKTNSADKCTRHKVVELTEEQRVEFEDKAAHALENSAVNLLVQQPFFGTLICGLKRVPIWAIPTMGVDGTHLFYNPHFTMKLSTKERMGVLCHEVLHLAYSHLHRRKGRLKGKWNAAADYAVDQTVKEANMSLPDFALFDEKYRGQSAEEIYNTLPDKPSQAGLKSNKCGECDGDGSGDSWESWDAHLDPTIDEETLAEKIVRAYEQTKHQGKLPAGLEAEIGKLKDPKMPWDEFLIRRAIDIFNREQYHWERQSRMSAVVAKSMKVKATWLPGMAKEEQRNLFIAIDTSGSCTHALEGFAAEIAHLMHLASNTYLCTIDAAAHEFVEVFPGDNLLEKIKFRGGGGTDFRPPFVEIQKRGIKPELCIYFTDGYGTFPETAPDYPVIWAFTEDHQAAPWGDSVVIKGIR